MKNQSFFRENLSENTTTNCVNWRTFFYATQNPLSPSSAGMETTDINADPPTSAPKRTQTGRKFTYTNSQFNFDCFELNFIVHAGQPGCLCIASGFGCMFIVGLTA